MDVTIHEREVRAASPEGRTATMGVEALFEGLGRHGMDTFGVVLPDGVKAVISRGPLTIWIHQTPPKVYNFKWITEDSPAPFGPATAYREVKIALPYLIVLATFSPGRDGRLQLGNANECFFRTSPLKSLDDPQLFYPALLNCSKFEPPEGKPLSWICTQYLARPRAGRPRDDNRRMRDGFQALLHCLLETGFNQSSEHHEASSWYTESTKVDPRVSTIENWEAATRENRMFVLDVPWLEVGLGVGAVAERIAKNHRTRRNRVSSAGDVAAYLFNHGEVREAEREASG